VARPGGVGDRLQPQLLRQLRDQLTEVGLALAATGPPARAAEPADAACHLPAYAAAPSRPATKSTASPTVSMSAASSSDTLIP
jgi:hypothetical protein